jgi:hypothetical protein
MPAFLGEIKFRPILDVQAKSLAEKTMAARPDD